jgi:hypothetical protein
VTKRSQGIAFSRSITMNFLKTALLTAIPFVIAARFFFSVYGIWVGTVLGYVAISPLAYAAWRVTGGRRAQSSTG